MQWIWILQIHCFHFSYFFQMQTNCKAQPQSSDVMSEYLFSDLVNLESDLSSTSSQQSQPSLEDCPDFLNCSYGTLEKFAALSNQDKFIYGDK